MRVTDLVNEVFIASKKNEPSVECCSPRTYWRQRVQHVLSRMYRGLSAKKRGGGRTLVSFDQDDIQDACLAGRTPIDAEDRLDLRDAVTRLEHDKPDQAEVIHMMLEGLTDAEIAQSLGIRPTQARTLRVQATQWLRRQLVVGE